MARSWVLLAETRAVQLPVAQAEALIVTTGAVPLTVVEAMLALEAVAEAAVGCMAMGAMADVTLMPTAARTMACCLRIRCALRACPRSG